MFIDVRAGKGWFQVEVERPKRTLKSAKAIAKYWAGRGTFPNADAQNPTCFGCGLTVSSWQSLDRAHLVDRFYDGLDVEPNIALLCVFCHKVMPSFEAGQGDEAIEWVLNEWKPRHLAHRYLMGQANGEAPYVPADIDAALGTPLLKSAVRRR